MYPWQRYLGPSPRDRQSAAVLTVTRSRYASSPAVKSRRSAPGVAAQRTTSCQESRLRTAATRWMSGRTPSGSSGRGINLEIREAAAVDVVSTLATVAGIKLDLAGQLDGAISMGVHDGALE